MKHVWSVDLLSKNGKVLMSETGKNPTTALYNEFTKSEKIFN